MNKSNDTQKKAQVGESVRSVGHEKRHQQERIDPKDGLSQGTLSDKSMSKHMVQEEKDKRSRSLNVARVAKAKIPSGKIMRRGTVRVSPDQMEIVTSKQSLETNNDKSFTQSFSFESRNESLHDAEVTGSSLEPTPPSPTTVRRKYKAAAVLQKEKGKANVPCSPVVESDTTQDMPRDDQIDTDSGKQSIEKESDGKHLHSNDIVDGKESRQQDEASPELTPPSPTTVRRKHNVVSVQEKVKRKAKRGAHCSRYSHKKKRFRVPATVPIEQLPQSKPKENKAHLSFVNQQRASLPCFDEKQVGIPVFLDTVDVEKGLAPTSTREPERESNGSRARAFSAYLVPTEEERRRRWLENAVVATNVHVITPTRNHESWSKKKQVVIVLSVALLMAIGIALGMTMSRGHHDEDSASPTPAPASTRFGQAASLVESLFNTTFEDPSTPQYQATQWISDVDTLFEDLTTVDPDRFSQRYVLALFYFATGGPTSWLETSFFLKPGIHECEWKDTKLPNTQSWSGDVGVFFCSSEDWVAGIEINQNNLTGTLPNELGALSSLGGLFVFHNNIGGTLPSSLSELSNLQILNLQSNEISGTIPTEIGRASLLRILYLGLNSFTGTLPSEIGNLSSLHDLGFFYNYLTGTIPETLKLSNITFLDGTGNALTGTLPPSLWSSWPYLTSFAIGENLLSGSIPKNLESVPLLEHLVLGVNNFTGSFPSSIVNLTQVRWFHIGNNNLTGSLPNDWSNLSQTLEHLGVDANRLTGTVPESLGSLTALKYLWLSSNDFNRTLPASLGNSTDLMDVRLNLNHFTGTVPTSFAQLTSLRYFWLRGNYLTGDISFLCNETDRMHPDFHDFTADCLGENAEVFCPCCTYCCAPANNTCVEMRYND